MLLDYERFVTKPVERKPAPAPVVRRELVRKAAKPEPETTRKGWQDFPTWVDRRRAWWPKLIALYLKNGTRSLAWYARQVGKHHTSVLYALRVMGLYKPRRTPEEIARLTAGRWETPSKRTLNLERMAARVAACIARGYAPQGTAHKLTPDDVRNIRAMDDELLASEIAPLFGVSRTTIARARSGRTWKYVK